MASLHKTIFIFSIVISLSHLSVESKVHIVGDSNGWDAGSVDYKKWASSIKFHPGDTLVFNYLPKIHNVMQVTQHDYESCNPPAKPIATYTTGKDSVALKMSGDYYYICGAPGHCDAGQKVHAKVVQGASSSSSSAPALSPTSSSSSTPPTPSSSSPPPMSKSPSEPMAKSPSGSPSMNVLPSKAPSPSSDAMAVAPSKALLYTLSMGLLAMLLVVNGHH